MLYDVVAPIDGCEGEKEFELNKMDDFFSVIQGKETKKQFRLMHFGALHSLVFKIPSDFKTKLEIDDIKDISIFYIFLLQTKISESTMNILSPIIFNHKSKKMGQVHLDSKELGLDNIDELLTKV